SQTGSPWKPTIVGIPVGNSHAGDMIDGIDISFDITMTDGAATGQGVAIDQNGAPIDGSGVVIDDTGMPLE
ncbi:MAG: hypothetical protein ACR2J8_04615, partial [Thermomicrobiales bacterium]